jgi:hypothetical protein
MPGPSILMALNGTFRMIAGVFHSVHYFRFECLIVLCQTLNAFHSGLVILR